MLFTPSVIPVKLAVEYCHNNLFMAGSLSVNSNAWDPNQAFILWHRIKKDFNVQIQHILLALTETRKTKSQRNSHYGVTVDSLRRGSVRFMTFSRGLVKMSEKNVLTYKENVINKVIIHAKWGKQLNEVKPIVTCTDKVCVLSPFKASWAYCCMTSHSQC